MNKHVVMLASDCHEARLVYNYLRTKLPLGEVVLEPPIPRRAMLRRRMQRLGRAHVLGQLLFKAAAEPLLRRAVAPRLEELMQQASLNSADFPHEVLRPVPSVNSPECRQALQACAPGVVLVMGTRIISQETLDSVDAPFMNMHAGVTPCYRGVHGGYWALHNNDPEHCGVSVHLVDKGIDTGAVLARERIQPTSRDNFCSYPLLQLVTGLPLLSACLARALEGRLEPLPPLDPERCPSRIYSHPTLFSYIKGRLRGVC